MNVYVDPIYRTPVRTGTPYIYREPYRRMLVELSPMAPSPHIPRRMVQGQLAPLPINLPIYPRPRMPVPMPVPMPAPMPALAPMKKKARKVKKTPKKNKSIERKLKVLRKMR